MKVAVIGVTGLVGREFLRILAERDFPVTELFLYSSVRSSGSVIKFRDAEVKVRELNHHNFRRADLALFSAGAAAARKWAEPFAESGALVIDNSSAFRNDQDIPLVVPEVNPERAFKHRGIIANPNCSTIVMVTALQPLNLAFNLESVVVTSFQSVSGAGRLAVKEYTSQLSDPSHEHNIFPRTIGGNVIPHIGDFDIGGVSIEEQKFLHETRKIMELPDLKVSATAVRVPVETGHSLSIYASFKNEIKISRAQKILAASQGIRFLPKNEQYPTPLEVTGKDDVYIGRLRTAEGFPNAVNMWVVSDNLRKGAALNAIQIAELVLTGDNP